MRNKTVFYRVLARTLSTTLIVTLLVTCVKSRAYDGVENLRDVVNLFSPLLPSNNHIIKSYTSISNIALDTDKVICATLFTYTWYIGLSLNIGRSYPIVAPSSF
jgi:hypothetical protein